MEDSLDVRIAALIADPATDPRVLVGCLRTLDGKLDDLAVRMKPLRKAADMLRDALLQKLNQLQIKSLKFEGLGSVTKADLKTFKLESPSDFWAWLEVQREGMTDKTEVYSFFSASLSKDMLNDTLSRTGALPSGVITNTVQSLRFTPTKE